MERHDEPYRAKRRVRRCALTTKAVPLPDGTYSVSGTKIFISWGDHDMTDQHRAPRLGAHAPTAPVGTKGISLFLVPKFLVNADGSVGGPNDVRCVSIEHKLGIKASPTAVMAFGENGGAVGHLVGEENQGMRYMFTMMNNARLTVGLEGSASPNAPTSRLWPIRKNASRAGRPARLAGDDC